MDTFTIDTSPAVCPDRSNACGWMLSSITIPVRDGYEIDTIVLDGAAWGYSGKGLGYGIIGTTFYKGDAQSDQNPFPTTLLQSTRGGNFLAGARGQQTVGVFMNDVRAATIQLTVTISRTPAAYAQWQSDVWNALYNAAQTQYFAQQQDIAARIADLENQLSNVDTLTLRREESDEIMRAALRFLLGIDFDFMPPEVENAFKSAGVDIYHGIGFDGNAVATDPDSWALVKRHEDVIRFINQAIEWENVVSFLYSYFWDVSESWDFVRRLRHPDLTRQAFLRAGSARVVLTVRKGWEEAWVRFAEGGYHGTPLPGGHPYLTIAQEIAAYDDRNYPGIPPANPSRSAVRLEDAVYTTSSAQLAAGADAPVVIPVESSAGFVPGLPVVIDVADGRGVQEAPMLLDVPDLQHLAVASLQYGHDGGTTPFPIVQPGSRGTLIAEWQEYTPTSGVDIQVTSNLADIV